MAETMHFNLVSPERRLMAAEVKSVQIPGADGDMTAMPDHAPVITTLRPGVLRVETTSGTEEFVVTGGFAELGDGLSVLAERALPRGDVDQPTYESIVAEAQAAYDQTKKTAGTDSGLVDDAAKMLADTVGIAAELGLNARQASF
jgi:F-type H+-transporting ATPase subunit epsilon